MELEKHYLAEGWVEWMDPFSYNIINHADIKGLSSVLAFLSLSLVCHPFIIFLELENPSQDDVTEY
eukprot:scaffold3882_cov164-Amphora_coffeaeformis.AAC.2